MGCIPALFVTVFAVHASAGLAPHEVLVLVNRQSARSKEVANHFVRLRQIPARNVVYLDVPERALEPRAQISPEQFTRHLWEPAQRAMQERGIEDQILAWIYSVDFPVRISTDPPTSIMGMTFLRDQFPADRDQVDKGHYRSPLFVGPDSPDSAMASGASLIRFKEELGDEMPLPSMMLGFCGSRGTGVDIVLRTLQYGTLADYSAPRGTVYWNQNDDVRSEMRAWQFPQALEELREAGVRGDVSSDLPADRTEIMGVQMGRPNVNAQRLGRHAPGSMAEHVTSHGAEFHLPIHTKLTDWIRAGATASAGTVVEPYALWTKFPHARFFPHYARGNTLLESFYLSIRSPTQILLVGEPLARPWAPRLSITLVAMDDGPLQGEASFVAALFPQVPPNRMEYRVAVNGQIVPGSSQGNQFSFDTRGLGDGHHELRVIAYVLGAFVYTTTGVLDVEVNNHGRTVRITSPPSGSDLDLDESFEVKAEASGEPQRLELIHNERVLARIDGDTAEFSIDAARLGAGPVALQVRAHYEDGMEVHSAPLKVTLERENVPPELQRLEQRETRSEPDWTAIEKSGGTLTEDDGQGCLFSPSTRAFDVILFSDKSEPLENLSGHIRVPSDRAEHPTNELAGFVFGYEDEDHFNFFLLHGEPSAWSFGRYRNGRLHHRLQRGAPLLRDRTHAIDLLFDEEGVTAYVNGEPVSTWSDEGALRKGRIGVLVGQRPVQIDRVRFEFSE